MKTNAAHITCNFKPGLYIVHNTPGADDQDILINAAWIFAYTALWNNISFSVKEINTAKEHITAFFAPVKNKREAFIIFCERVLLARDYVTADKKRFIPLPSVWLCKQNIYGFAGTKKWYNHLRTTRYSLPGFKSEINVLAQVALEYAEQPTIFIYRKWKNYFISRRYHGVVILFQLFVINHSNNL